MLLVTISHTKASRIRRRSFGSTDETGTVEAATNGVLTRLLTVADVSMALQVSERQVRRWIAEGSLPAVHLGRAVRIRPADFDQLVAAGVAD